MQLKILKYAGDKIVKNLKPEYRDKWLSLSDDKKFMVLEKFNKTKEFDLNV